MAIVYIIVAIAGMVFVISVLGFRFLFPALVDHLELVEAQQWRVHWLPETGRCRNGQSRK